MPRDVVWAQPALDDLKDAIRYIAEDDVTASRVVELRIRTAGERLGEFASGHPGRVNGVYEKRVPKTRYILAYSIDRSRSPEAIVIVRAIHASRNWPVEEWPE